MPKSEDLTAEPIGFYAYVHCKPGLIPFYVGKGRKSRAFCTNPKERNLHYARVVKKYGRENIQVEAIFCESEHEAFLREKLIISALRMAGVQLCNFTDGGEGTSGWKHSKQTLIKLSKASMGQVKSKEVREKIGLIHKGKVISDETKSLMSKAHTGVSKSPEAIIKSALARKGVVRTDEQKANIARGKLESKLRRGINNA